MRSAVAESEGAYVHGVARIGDEKIYGADPDNRVLGLLWDLCARADLATTNKTA